MRRFISIATEREGEANDENDRRFALLLRHVWKNEGRREKGADVDDADADADADAEKKWNKSNMKSGPLSLDALIYLHSFIT